MIKNAEGRVIWDIDAYGAVTQGECPPTVDPSLWRQAKLTGLLLSGSLDGAETAGDAGVLKTLMGLTDESDPDFAVVTP